jgi:hypothetical protein
VQFDLLEPLLAWNSPMNDAARLLLLSDALGAPQERSGPYIQMLKYINGHDPFIPNDAANQLAKLPYRVAAEPWFDEIVRRIDRTKGFDGLLSTPSQLKTEFAEKVMQKVPRLRDRAMSLMIDVIAEENRIYAANRHHNEQELPSESTVNIQPGSSLQTTSRLASDSSQRRLRNDLVYGNSNITAAFLSPQATFPMPGVNRLIVRPQSAVAKQVRSFLAPFEGVSASRKMLEKAEWDWNWKLREIGDWS